MSKNGENARKEQELVDVFQWTSKSHIKLDSFCQFKEKLSRKRYTATTTFVDHCLDLNFIHFMIGVTSKETMPRKIFNVFVMNTFLNITTVIRGGLGTGNSLMMSPRRIRISATVLLLCTSKTKR